MRATKYNKSEILLLAWQFVKRNGFSMSEALTIAWRGKAARL